MPLNRPAPSIIWRFIGELSNRAPGSISIDLMGSALADLPAITEGNNITGFYGVYFMLNPSGSISMKAQLTKSEGADKNLTKTFNLSKLEVNEAYALAVKERATYLGLSIEIPKLKTITYTEVYKFICSKYGSSWTSKANASGFLTKMKQEQSSKELEHD